MPENTQEEASMPYNPHENELAEIERALRRHEAMLMARPGVTGVALARSPIGDPAILVYLSDRKYRTGLPARLDGHPVVTEVTGPIEAQPR